MGVLVFQTLDGCVFIENGPYIDCAAICSHTPAPPESLKVGDRVRDEYDLEYTVASPKRVRSNGKEEYSLWHDENGYRGWYANTIETWERIA